MTRTITGAIVCVLLAAPWTGAHACAEYAFEPVAAVARIKGNDGKWRGATVEASESRIRIETEDRRTPWGRLAIVGDVQGPEARLFPVANGGRVPKGSREVWATTFDVAFGEIGMHEDYLYAPWYAQYDGRYSNVNGIPCRLPDVNFDKYWPGSRRYKKARWTCTHTSGLPLMMTDAEGRRVFEVLKIMPRAIAAVRFKPPPSYAITRSKPGYLKEGFTC